MQDAEAVLEIGETTTAEVVADTDAILQVLSNLIENGIKYGQARNEPHCRILVSAHEVSEPDGSFGPGGAVEFIHPGEFPKLSVPRIAALPATV